MFDRLADYCADHIAFTIQAAYWIGLLVGVWIGVSA